MGGYGLNVDLARYAWQYAQGVKTRPAADPLGMRGLPAIRDRLDELVADLCGRLHVAGKLGLRGAQLVGELHLQSTRALRLLVAYARVHHHVHQIVGVPGDRYYWGDCVPGLYKRTIRDNERRARDFFFIAALHRRQGTAMAAVQLMFNFMEHNVPAAERYQDDLAALVASEGVTVAGFLDAFVGSLAKTDEGRRALREVGRKHAQVLLPADAIKDAVAKLDEVKAALVDASKRGTPRLEPLSAANSANENGP